MTTTNYEQKASASGDNWQWPEALKDKPTIDPFPARLLVRWLIPGLVGLVLILVIYAILTRAANRQVLWFYSDGWQKRSEELYSAAGEAARALGAK